MSYMELCYFRYIRLNRINFTCSFLLFSMWLLKYLKFSLHLYGSHYVSFEQQGSSHSTLFQNKSACSCNPFPKVHSWCYEQHTKRRKDGQPRIICLPLPWPTWFSLSEIYNLETNIFVVYCFPGWVIILLNLSKLASNWLLSKTWILRWNAFSL